MPPLQLVWSSCRPQILFGTSLGIHTCSAHTPRRTQYVKRASEKRREPVECTLLLSCQPRWSFSRPTRTSSLSSAFMKPVRTSSLPGLQGDLIKEDTKTGALWWECVGMEDCFLALQDWKTSHLQPPHSRCHSHPTRSKSTAQVSACHGPARCVSASQ